MLVFYIYKKLQLFWFGLLLSANVMVFAAVSAGDLNYTDIQTETTRIATRYMQDHPDGAVSKMAAYMIAQIDPGAPEGFEGAEPEISGNGLAALRARSG